MLTHCVVLAGGGGNRLWPLSKPEKPKQFLPLLSEKTMLQETIERILPLSDGGVSVVAHSSLEALVKESLQGLLGINLIKEPAMRNTAAAIGLAAFTIKQTFGDGVVCVFPADHYIKSPSKKANGFIECLTHAVKVCESSKAIVTIGIKPTHASSAYGYLKCGSRVDLLTKVCKRFVEKPDKLSACSFIEDGNYLWNSGMFVFRTDVMLNEIRLQMPKLYDVLSQLERFFGKEEYDRALQALYPSLENISIDYGIMENAEKVYAIAGDFEWSDLGSFAMLSKLYKSDALSNSSNGDGVFFDSSDCFSYSEDRRIVTIGLDGVCVIDDGKNLLVCPKDKSEELGRYVSLL